MQLNITSQAAKRRSRAETSYVLSTAVHAEGDCRSRSGEVLISPCSSRSQAFRGLKYVPGNFMTNSTSCFPSLQSTSGLTQITQPLR